MKVKIYKTPNCKYCKSAAEFFEENGVEFEAIDVSADLAAKAEMIEMTGQMGVPVIIIGNDAVVGFNKAKLSELLGIKDEKVS